MGKAVLEAPRITWLIEPTFDDDGVQRTAGIDQFGREHGDPVPLSPPIGLSVGQGDELHRALRQLLARQNAEFQAAVEREQFESEAEANDFLTADELFPPGNEAWEDVFEFPAEEPGSGVGNGAGLAPGAVKEEAKGRQVPPSPPTPNSPPERPPGAGEEEVKS